MNNLWNNIFVEDVIKAIELFDKMRESYPEPRNTFLIYNNKKYPAKHIRGMAYYVANKIKISKQDYNGGMETVRFFTNLGFDVEYHKKTLKPKTKPLDSFEIKNRKEPQTEVTLRKKLNPVRQKNALLLLLEKHYSSVEKEKIFDWLRTPDCKELPEEYKNIVSALSGYRNYSGFQESYCQPKCDFVLNEHKIIIEYDERQHFTQARRIALENYPLDIALRFSKEKWIEACIKINAKDDTPFDRDERRAYYDTVRDIEAYKHGYTLIRIKHGEIDWESDIAVDYLNQLIGIKKEEGSLNGLVNHKFARLITTGLDYDENGYPNYPRLYSLLDGFIMKFHGKRHFEFIITAGGFLTFKFPATLQNRLNIEYAERNLITVFQDEADRTIQDFFSQMPEESYKGLQEIADYITIGIDGHNPINKQLIELVAVYDLKLGQVLRWTGKFYPVESQRSQLIKIKDLNSHFIELNNQRLVILGCHDLIVYSPRGQAAASPEGWKRKIADEFKLLCEEFKPDLILQHPHLTHSPNVWNLAWRTLEKELPCVKHFASGIKYSHRKSVIRDLQSVLHKTKKGDVIDFYMGM